MHGTTIKTTSTSVVPDDGFWLKLKHVTQYATRCCESVVVIDCFSSTLLKPIDKLT